MKFAHMADMHLGSWKEPRLRDLSTRAFEEAIGKCVKERVDFVLLAGDLFNTSLPPIDTIKTAVSELKKLRKNNIPVYTIAGSHDFSPSGKTMLDVLEEAELVVNVCRGDVNEGKLTLKFTIDKKTGAKITGMLGKKGMLDTTYYEALDTSQLISEQGFKIFMFHTALAELKPEELEKMEAAPVSLLPVGFDYYAGGHVHIIKEATLEGYKKIVYPGPTFPNSFSEIEKLSNGGFYIYEDGKLRYEELNLKKVISIELNCEHKKPEEVTAALIEEITSQDVKDAIILLRLFGVIEEGKTTDINTAKVFSILEERGAYIVLKNTNQLSTKEFETRSVSAATTEEAEALLIKEHAGQVKTLELNALQEKELVDRLMTLLDIEKEEGQKQADYEAKIIAELSKEFNS